jgi:hypothetical protein
VIARRRTQAKKQEMFGSKTTSLALAATALLSTDCLA